MDYSSFLNKEQMRVVSTSSQYTRVIAGAGSGKTRVLTYRIAYLISEFGVDPSKILAIAFTNKVANEMKDRVIKLLPSVSNFLHISTFHSFGATFLRKEIQNLGFSPSFTIFDDDDTKHLIRDICVSKNYSKKDDFIDEALNYILYKKQQGYYPQDIKVNGHYSHEEECLEIFKIYEEKKSNMIAIDFEDLLLLPIIILENYPEVRKKWQDRYPHILVDEFQDINNVQFTLIKLLSSQLTSLFVVGDPDQTIYTWRGANQKIILDFDKTYKGSETIILDQNYRSTKTILDAANKLIANNKERVKKDLFTDNINGEKIDLYKAASKDDEASHVISSIIKLKEKNIISSFREVAILYRSSYLTLPFEKELVKKRINYRVYGGVRFYQRKEIKDALAYFRLIMNHKDDVSFDRILNVPKRKIGEKSSLDLKKEAASYNLSYFEYIENIEHYDSNLSSSVIISLTALVNKIKETKKQINDNDELYSKILEDFLIDIGFYDYIETLDDSDERIDNIKTLFAEMNDFVQKNPDEGFDKWLENATLATSQDELKDDNYVSLMTVHVAKGLEFNYVYVIGLSQNIFPNQRAMSERDGLEEERRLAYVAFTRAKKKLSLSMNNGYSYILESNAIESQFIKEAGLKMPESNKYYGNKFTYDKALKIFNNNNNFYNEDTLSDFESLPVKESKSVFTVDKKNDITDWAVGDEIMHDKFGEGKVIKVIDKSIIVVDFKQFGKKTMVASHFMIKRISKNTKEMN